jgi:chemotaxis protein methyltransferase CheR
VSAFNEPTLTQEDFSSFRDLFRRRTGITFEEGKRYFVDRRLKERIVASGQGSCRQYLNFVQLESSHEELQQLVNVMTVNETYFFREDYQLKTLADEVMNEVAQRKAPGTPIRIWSMPCSTGEEPYSIAIYLLENWPRIHEIDVEIVGSDINSVVLEACREGIYTPYALRSLSPALLKKYFTRVSQTTFQISAELRTSMTFTLTNITDTAQMRRFRDFDLVFCRNLLIYFDEAKRREAVENLYNVLTPGGYVFLGHSESMSRISGLFTVAKVAGFLVYQKPLEGHCA